jgi:hypothetical protein
VRIKYMSKKEKDKQCFWCGSLGNDTNPVTVSEDVPPRWLSGIKKVKKVNCVPQCEECKINLAVLDNAVNGYFKYGAAVDLDKVEKDTEWTKNKGIASRKIKLNGNDDYAQSNGSLLLWLRKLLVGVWYKEKGTRFDGLMLFLTSFLSFDNPDRYTNKIVKPLNVSMELLLNIDDALRYNYLTDFVKKVPFTYTFFNESHNIVPSPLQLLRFGIYGSYVGYCLFIPASIGTNTKIFLPLYEKSPLYIDKWIYGYQYIRSSDVVKLVDSTKSITAEEATKRVRL